MSTKPNVFRRPGQALVETALIITLLFLLLSAVVDVGLVFFAYQSITNAAQEGVAYGSLQKGLDLPNPPSIRLRVRNETGPNSGTYRLPRRVGVVDMQDLDSDGSDDSAPVQEQRIVVQYGYSQYGEDVGRVVDCPNAPQPAHCEVKVSVSFVYRPFFFLAPIFGAREVPLSVTRSMTIIKPSDR